MILTPDKKSTKDLYSNDIPMFFILILIKVIK